MSRPAADATPASTPATMTPTRRLRVEALRRTLLQAEQVVAASDDLVRHLTPWLPPRG